MRLRCSAVRPPSARRSYYNAVVFTIGLTGGIASGKSSVARLLGGHGARVLDADHLAHATYAPGSPGHAAILQAFGSGVLAADGTIDRRALGGLIFADEAARGRLNAIVWPLARLRIEALKRAEVEVGTAVLVIEVALLIEAGWQDLVDEVWLVRAPDAAVRERLLERSGLDDTEADARIAAQPDTAGRVPYADVVIDNEADLGALARRVAEAWALLQKRLG